MLGGGRALSDLVAMQVRQPVKFSVPNVVSQLAARMAHLSPQAAARRPRACLSVDLDHYSQKGDDGSWWSCGYRNIQMLCSSLLRDPLYGPKLFGGAGFVPDLTSLQCWIERAWSLGFDPEGAAQLGGSLLYAPKWIGSTEAVALLRSFGVPARVVAFHSFDSPVVGQALGPAAAARAKASREAAEAELLAATGKTPDQVLRPWAYDEHGA
jgi:hypothetical protein